MVNNEECIIIHRVYDEMSTVVVVLPRSNSRQQSRVLMKRIIRLCSDKEKSLQLATEGRV